jgi:hypothetical protein
MGKVINSTAMTVDGLVDVRDWFPSRRASTTVTQ